MLRCKVLPIVFKRAEPAGCSKGGIVNKTALFSKAAILASLVCIAYYYLAVNRAVVNLEVETDNRTLFKMYYKGQEGNWSESRVATVALKPGVHHYSVRLTNIEKISELRIDPSEKPANVTIRSMIIRQYGFQPLRLDSQNLAQIKPLAGIAALNITGEGLTVTPANGDPQLLYSLPDPVKTSSWAGEVLGIVVLATVAFALVYSLRTVVDNYRFVLVFAAAALGLSLVMAAISTYDQHPDEGVHVQAADYYINHLLPPEVGDPDIAFTYSKYGVSRLHSGEIAYLVAGKFASLLEPLHLPIHLSFRLFNVTLFIVLVLFACIDRQWRIILLPFLLSAQIWYIFSYFNSEAFALFIILLIAYQVAVEGSTWNRMLDSTVEWVSPAAIAALGLLFGMLLLLKMNFYFFIVFLLLYFCWRLIFGKTKLTRKGLGYLLAVSLIGVFVFAVFRLTDSSINDFQKDAKILEAREQYADPMFKPSTPIDKKYAFLQMRDRGVSLRSMIDKGRWGEKTFRSAFGEYGYMTVAASFEYYDAVRLTGLLLLAAVVLSILIGRDWYSFGLLAITIGCTIALMVVALYHAWTTDFQAQGRYLLPVVGMVAVFVCQLRRQLANFSCLLLFLLLYGLSLYSFIFVGIAGIGKAT